MWLLADAISKTPPPADILTVISPYMGVFFVAFGVAFVATPIMRWLAVNNGIIDWPDFKRKAHGLPVAYLGGVAIFVGWLAGVVTCMFLVPHNADLYPSMSMDHVSFKFSIILGATIIMLTGMLDDVYGISPRVKIGGQLLAAAALASEDVGLRLVSDLFNLIGVGAPDWLVYILGATVITIFIIGGCNSVNLLDGLDGLAAGVCAIAAIGFLAISGLVALEALSNQKLPGADVMTDPVRIVMCLALLGALLGFIPYNFNPAIIFMGDAGSLLLGFLCVTTILLFSYVPVRGPMLVMAALIVFALPITDTLLAIVRRKIRGQPIFSPDKNHIHHQALSSFQHMGLDKNHATKAAVMSMYVLALIFAVVGVSMIYLRWRFVLAVFLFIFGFVVVMAFKSGQRQLMQQKMEQALAAKIASENASHSVATTSANPPPAADPNPTVNPAAATSGST